MVLVLRTTCHFLATASARAAGGAANTNYANISARWWAVTYFGASSYAPSPDCAAILWIAVIFSSCPALLGLLGFVCTDLDFSDIHGFFAVGKAERH